MGYLRTASAVVSDGAVLRDRADSVLSVREESTVTLTHTCRHVLLRVSRPIDPSF